MNHYRGENVKTYLMSLFKSFKQQHNIAYLWTNNEMSEAKVELDCGTKSWYIPFYYGTAKLIIDEYTFRKVHRIACQKL